jgi:hypothetical protein
MERRLQPAATFSCNPPLCQCSMNSKRSWILLTLAVVLFAFIFLVERHINRHPAGPPRVFPGLKAREINSIQVQPKGQRAIRAIRTNDTWELTDPLRYPAYGDAVEALLSALENLTSTPYFSGQDLKSIPDADAQFGFNTPQFSVMIDQKRYLVLIGRRTPPGDRVYLQVVGLEGVFVVDAGLLGLVPQSPDQWRDTALADWAHLEFDRLTVSNAGKLLELQLNPTNNIWRMLSPNDVRADSAKVRNRLLQLEGMRAQQFISDEPDADLESFGLQTPELSLAFLRDTNTVLRFDFGKSPTNNPALVYARKAGEDTVVTVPKIHFEPWSASQTHVFRDFFDPHLMPLARLPDRIEVTALENFTLERSVNGAWRVMPAGFAADAALMAQFFGNLTNLQVTASQIEKDIVPAADLPSYGLAQPFRQYILMAKETGAENGTNSILRQLDFGTNQNKLFARVQGESFVYSMDPAILDLLPTASWQMRDRRIWNFKPADVAAITIEQDTRTRQLLRKGERNWTLAPGSQGMIDETLSAEIERTVLALGDLTAAFWVQRGDANLDLYGFKETAHRISIELISGEKFALEFGKEAPSRFPYAATRLDGETWVFEFPWTTYQFIQFFLTIPPGIP